MSTVPKSSFDALFRTLGILLVDENLYMRRIVRNLLMTVGVREVFEASDGIAGLEAIRTYWPDIVIIDWDLPLLNGAEFVRIVRSPGVFPKPDVPIVVLSSQPQRWRVLEAARLGVNEYLCKPVAARTLYDRLFAILARPRAVVQMGDYYGPAPRRLLPDLDLSSAPAPGSPDTPLN